MAVLRPMPIASVTTPSSVNPGDFSSCRNTNRRSVVMAAPRLILCLGRLRHYLISSSVEAGESLLSLSQSDQHFWSDVDHPYTYESCPVAWNSTSISPPRGAVATR